MCVVFMLSSPHQINWLRIEEDVPPHAVVTGSDLYIENLNKSYNGTYRCVASNAVGEAYDDYILYVYGRCRYNAWLHFMSFKRPHHSFTLWDTACITVKGSFRHNSLYCFASQETVLESKDLLQNLPITWSHFTPKWLQAIIERSRGA